MGKILWLRIKAMDMITLQSFYTRFQAKGPYYAQDGYGT